MEALETATMSGAAGEAVAPDVTETQVETVDTPSTGADGAADDAAESASEPAAASREDNRSARLARLAAQREASVRIEAAERAAEQRVMGRVNGVLERLNLRHPDTDSPIGSFDSLSAYADEVSAHARGQSPDEFRAERTANEQKDAELESLRAQVAGMQAAENARRLADDLAALKAAYPDIKAADMQEFANTDIGKSYVQLMAALPSGTDPLLAYNAALATRSANTKAAPPSMGSLKSAANREAGEYFSEAELDALSSAQLMRDPALRAKAEKSYQHLLNSKRK